VLELLPEWFYATDYIYSVSLEFRDLMRQISALFPKSSRQNRKYPWACCWVLSWLRAVRKGPVQARPLNKTGVAFLPLGAACQQQPNFLFLLAINHSIFLVEMDSQTFFKYLFPV